jgi:CDP-paratose 2-epimerase
MKQKTILVTGSSGLICSEVVVYFDLQGYRMVGVNNNMPREFFGPAGDTLWNLQRLKDASRNFAHVNVDIRDREALNDLFSAHSFELIVDCAAQPSHDKALDIPMVDFGVNGLRTVNLLEATRQQAPEAVSALAFIPNGDYSASPCCSYAVRCFILKKPSGNHPGCHSQFR